MTSKPTAGDSTDREERLAAKLEELFADGTTVPDFDRMRNSDPDLADELQQLWMTARLARELSDSPEVEPTEIVSPPRLTRLGEYRIEELIGQGGMGLVYRGYHPQLQRSVAIKILRNSRHASPEDRQRFAIESRAAAQLQHPHIVPVYEVGEAEGHLYFTMQLVEGQTAAQQLAEGPLDSRAAARIMLPIAEAIQHAHEHGVFHRDLKPSNILINRRGVPFVSDFGLAKQYLDTEHDSVESLTLHGAIVGTPGYLAPEQASGVKEQIGPATDVYGLGALLYALLTGRAPFQSASPLQTILMASEQDPLPPRMLNPDVDVDLELIALKCLQRPQDLRYPTPGRLADDLRAYLANEPVSARSSRFAEVISRAFRETHHAAVLRNWGLLWMWHSLALLVLCVVTNVMQLSEIRTHWPYVVLWTAGLGLWALIFWNLRRRSGPVTFVERQIAHVWAASMCASSLLFAIEAILGLPVLALSPVLGLLGGIVFLVKAGILTGRFYVQSLSLFATALVMAGLSTLPIPPVAISLFGIVSAACFFFPGLKYAREKQAGR